MESAYVNNEELRNFVFDHKLMNKQSIIQFNAKISIVTAKNKITNLRSKVMITFNDFDSYGKVTLLDNDIAPDLYPTVLEAKWQLFKHVNKEYLEITGNHTHNENIGNYTLRITPLERLRD